MEQLDWANYKIDLQLQKNHFIQNREVWRRELVDGLPAHYVLIQGGKMVGIYESRNLATNIGMKGGTPFFVGLLEDDQQGNQTWQEVVQNQYQGNSFGFNNHYADFGF